VGAHIQLITKAFIHLAGVAQVELWRRHSNPQECEKNGSTPPKGWSPKHWRRRKMANKINANTKLQKHHVTVWKKLREKIAKKKRETRTWEKVNQPPHVIIKECAMLSCFFFSFSRVVWSMFVHSCLAYYLKSHVSRFPWLQYNFDNYYVIYGQWKIWNGTQNKVE
jgi:hypothetical protein